MTHDAQQPHSSQKGDVTEVVLVSHNPHKIVEMQDMLSKFCASVRVLSASQIGLTDEIEENGTTFEENALIKARAAAFRLTRCMARPACTRRAMRENHVTTTATMRNCCWH